MHLYNNRITEISEKWNSQYKLLYLGDNNLNKISDEWNSTNIIILILDENVKISLNEYIVVHTSYRSIRYAKINNIPDKYINNKICSKCQDEIKENDYYIVDNEIYHHII